MNQASWQEIVPLRDIPRLIEDAVSLPRLGGKCSTLDASRGNPKKVM
jgi:hypothetical protein